MTFSLRIGGVAVAACIGLAGCAGFGLFDAPPDGPGSVRTLTGQSITPAAAMESIAIGKSRKADVSTALGPAIAIPFDSGYEVWVYRWPGRDRTPRGATELVVLFEPSGLVKKVRIRPGYATREP
jgi:hypothetical protein